MKGMPVNKLSSQEFKISHLIANGFIAKEIADKLCVSPLTVSTHMRNIRKKLHAKNIADITRCYILSLPKATDVLKTLLFVAIQFSVIITQHNLDFRQPTRVQPRSLKTMKKQ